MGEYLRWTALVLTAVVLSLCISRTSREQSVLMSLTVCVLVGTAALGILEPVLELVRELRRMGELGGEAVSVLLKTALIASVTEIAVTVCSEAGEGSMGKVLQLLSNAVILWLSLPLVRQLLTLIEGVLAQN